MSPPGFRHPCITELPVVVKHYDPAYLDRLHTLSMGVVSLIGVTVLAALIVCLACTRASRHPPQVGAPIAATKSLKEETAVVEDDARISCATQHTLVGSDDDMPIDSLYTPEPKRRNSIYHSCHQSKESLSNPPTEKQLSVDSLLTCGTPGGEERPQSSLPSNNLALHKLQFSAY